MADFRDYSCFGVVRLWLQASSPAVPLEASLPIGSHYVSAAKVVSQSVQSNHDGCRREPTVTAAPDFPSSLQWSINHYPSDRAIQALRNELMAYNIVTAAMDASQDMAVFLHDTHGQLRGGIVGRI
jgi:hypothetical protein